MKKLSLRMFAMVLAAILVLAGVPAAFAEGGEKVVTLAATASWLSLDPMSWHTKDAQVAFSYPVFDGLVDVTAQGEIVPRLLCSWEQSEDGATVIGKVDPNAYWHDGEKVTAHDIVFTFELFTNPEVECERITNIGGTDAAGVLIEGEELGVKALDDETVEFTMNGATTIINFFYNMRYSCIVPEHLLKDIPAASVLTDEFWEHPVGSGAFKFDSYISGERMEYVANDDYYKGRPDFDRLIIRVIPSNNILSAIMSGEVDSTVYGSLMTYTDYELAKLDSSLTTYEAPGFANQHIIINNSKYDTDVRRAFDMAINKQAIIDDLLMGYARVAISAIVPENPYRLEGIEGNPYDPEAAKALLAEAGWDESQKLLLITQPDPANTNIAVMLQQMLAEVGVQIEIQTYDMATLSSMMFAGEYDLALMGSASNPFEPSESRFYFVPYPEGWNCITDTSWRDLYDASLASYVFEERKVCYDELQERLVAEVPMIFLFHKDVLFVSSSRLGNLPYSDFSLKSWRYDEWTVE